MEPSIGNQYSRGTRSVRYGGQDIEVKIPRVAEPHASILFLNPVRVGAMGAQAVFDHGEKSDGINRAMGSGQFQDEIDIIFALSDRPGRGTDCERSLGIDDRRELREHRAVSKPFTDRLIVSLGRIMERGCELKVFAKEIEDVVQRRNRPSAPDTCGI
jgi:hypothetical protein